MLASSGKTSFERLISTFLFFFLQSLEACAPIDCKDGDLDSWEACAPLIAKSPHRRGTVLFSAQFV